MTRFFSKIFVLCLIFNFCLALFLVAFVSWSPVYGYRVKSSTDPTFECSGCARTRLIGCFHGQCSYRCYRSCTNGTDVVIEAHRFVLEGQRKRRKRYLQAI